MNSENDINPEILHKKRKLQVTETNVTNANNVEPAKNLLDLDDDCLYRIFSFLNLYEVFVVDKVKNNRIHKIITLYYERKASHFESGKFFNYGDFRPYDEHQVFDIIGPYVTNAALDNNVDFRSPRWSISADRVMIPLLAEKCSNLRSLELQFLDVVGKRIKKCEDFYRRLDKLILYKCLLYENPDTIGSVFSNLSYLSISYSKYVYGHFLLHMKNLKTLHLKGCPKVKNEHLNKLLTSEDANKLEDFLLVKCRDVMTSSLNFSFSKSLKSLCLDFSRAMFTESTIDVLLQLTKLTKLNLSCCVNDAMNIDSFLTKMSEKCTLEELKLRHFKFGLETINAIALFKQLKTFAGDFLLKDEHVSYLKLARVLPALKYLSLKDISITDNESIILGMIMSLPSLKRFDLYKTYSNKCMNICQQIVNILQAEPFRPSLTLSFFAKVDRVPPRLGSTENPEDSKKVEVEFLKSNKRFLTLDVVFDDYTDDDDDDDGFDRYSDSDSRSSGHITDSRYWSNFNDSSSESDSDESESANYNADYENDLIDAQYDAALEGYYDFGW